MRMINDSKEGLEELLRCNDAMREQEEHIERQEEPWVEYKQISKAQ